jgi:hypothetical protein
VDDHVQVLLGVVGGNLLESEFLGGRHGDGVVERKPGNCAIAGISPVSQNKYGDFVQGTKTLSTR